MQESKARLVNEETQSSLTDSQQTARAQTAHLLPLSAPINSQLAEIKNYLEQH